ncbi:nicotinate-nucleotide adenylyltransferase [Marinisporobacter balticus]|uniref:Probable nicotinate-nucleotide adenylyltransferase n=1 Tax=Marinisporobacter balticus TaxID=2018667 RepID=A0A4R2KYQ0_9FIRM|nr:nicotinate-nucleotide adenylyltransferase [Marinisporobacter balticus]TCO79023.1 nicotinate-nucleotide adenylyltransferase [Marinisporobacter balticus]
MSITSPLDLSNKSSKVSKVGVMGGTFDPIHYGHLVIAEQIRCEYELEKVIFIPAGIPPHKSNVRVTDRKDRYLMTLLATITNPYFEVSRIELDSNEISYTIHTIQKLKKIYGKDTELHFITGADAICELDTWKDVENLSKLCTFIAATRPGLENSQVDEKIETLKWKYNTSIKKIKLPALAISSTDIRNRIREGQSVKYLLPEPVEYYIHKNNVYV